MILTVNFQFSSDMGKLLQLNKTQSKTFAKENGIIF